MNSLQQLLALQVQFRELESCQKANCWLMEAHYSQLWVQHSWNCMSIDLESCPCVANTMVLGEQYLCLIAGEILWNIIGLGLHAQEGGDWYCSRVLSPQVIKMTFAFDMPTIEFAELADRMIAKWHDYTHFNKEQGELYVSQKPSE